MDSTVMMLRQMGGVNLDVDATFIIQLAVIVVTMLVLRKLVFQPYLRVAGIRDELTTNTAARAEETARRAESLAADFEAKLQIAKQEALAAKTKLRAEGTKEKDELLNEASQEAQTLLRDAKEKLESEIKIVQDASQGLVDELADLIVAKVLNRPSEPVVPIKAKDSGSTEEVQA